MGKDVVIIVIGSNKMGWFQTLESYDNLEQAWITQELLGEPLVELAKQNVSPGTFACCENLINADPNDISMAYIHVDFTKKKL